jgi:hypothetical protein
VEAKFASHGARADEVRPAVIGVERHVRESKATVTSGRRSALQAADAVGNFYRCIGYRRSGLVLYLAVDGTRIAELCPSCCSAKQKTENQKRNPSKTHLNFSSDLYVERSVFAVVEVAAGNEAVAPSAHVMGRADWKQIREEISGLSRRWSAGRRIVEEKLLMNRYDELLNVFRCKERTEQ